MTTDCTKEEENPECKGGWCLWARQSQSTHHEYSARW